MSSNSATAPKQITMNGETFSSYSEAAEKLNKSVSAISKYVAKYGTLEMRDGATKELLESGKLGKVYRSTQEARIALGITTPNWNNFVKRIEAGVPLKYAKDDEVYKKYREEIKNTLGVKFKEPIKINDKEYTYWGEINNDFKDDLGEIAAPQVIRKRRRKGIKGIDLIRKERVMKARLDYVH